MPSDVLLSAMESWTRWLARDLDVEVAVVWPVHAGREHSLGQAHLLRLGETAAVRLGPSDVFGAALRGNADAVAIGHTHLTDSGPSESDHAVTRRLVAAGLVLGVPLVAHLLVEPRGAYELVSGRHVVQREVPAA